MRFRYIRPLAAGAAAAIIAAPDAMMADIYHRPPLKTWSTDHAVTPHLGQGANQAVEDAITLAVLLQDAQAADIPMRLRRYDDLRIERTRQVHDGSREAGALYRSTELSPGQQAERIVAINDRLQLDTHDAERIANDAPHGTLTTR